MMEWHDVIDIGRRLEMDASDMNMTGTLTASRCIPSCT